MKNITPFLFLLITFSFFAQSSEKMSYQAVIRDATNTLVTNQSVGMQISILQTTTTGTAIYTETQTVSTNTNGLLSLEIGMGVTSDDFSAIDWKAGPYFIKTETDPTGGTSYTITGTSQLMSVPFAMYSKTSGDGITVEQSDAIIENTGKVSMVLGTTAKTALAGDTSIISSDQTDAIEANTAKEGYTEAAVSNNTAVAANTLKVGITAQQASDITSNTAKTVITTEQSDAIVANTAKTGITSDQATAIGDNTAKLGYTEAAVSANTAVAANTLKVGITTQQASDITSNTAKTGITSDQATAITDNTTKVGYTDALVSANTAVAANTLKIGITAQQTSAITDNTAKTGITSDQATAITDNTAKLGMPVGNATGQMNYWNGIIWETITPGNSGAVLQMVGTTPTWVSNADIVAPVVTVTSGTDTVEQGSTWTDTGATADTGETVVVSGTVDTNTLGTYTITYTATDAAGNVGTATRTVIVYVTTLNADGTKNEWANYTFDGNYSDAHPSPWLPLLTAPDGYNIILYVEGGYVAEYDTNTNNIPDLLQFLQDSGNIDGAGYAGLFYIGPDKGPNGNWSAWNGSYTWGAYAALDTTAPVITVTPGIDTVEQGSAWTDAGATSDGGETITASDTVDTNTAGIYTITYTATDAAGNTGTATRTVTVVEPQVITLHSNGVTLVAEPSAVTGQSYDYNGTSYLVVDNSSIAANKTANIVTTRVTSMASLFQSQTTFNGNISHWDTAAVTDMSNMFYAATVFNQNIGSWDTAAVTDMSNMFYLAAVFNQNIGSWDTAAVTNMKKLFSNAPAFNQNIGSWNTAAVTNMGDLFYAATVFNQNISSWNTAAVTRMGGMFQFASAFNQDIGNWNVSLVTNMDSMLRGAYAFNQNIGSWDTAAVTNMAALFQSASAFNQDIGNWDTAAVTTMQTMFRGASSFTQNISSWNTAAVTNMSEMFQENTTFNQNIGSWNTGAVTKMFLMFDGATAFNQDIGSWNTAAVSDMRWMFRGATAFNQNISNWCVQTHFNLEPSDFKVGANDTWANDTSKQPDWDAASCPLLIGDTHQGGIIFYLDGHGGGLIAAPTDQSNNSAWGCFGTSIVTGSGIVTGAQNTINIEAGCTTSGTAADICANLTLGGYSDWFLPSKDELNQMYLNIGGGSGASGLGNVGNFSTNFYWSSTEYDYNSAWKQDFDDGFQYFPGKDFTYYVRAVRAF